MHIYLKQILYIFLISLLLSIVRYIFIEEDYPIIKSTSQASVETYYIAASIDSLKNYLNNIKEPKIIDIELAEKIYKNKLATFIDARDEESFYERHIEGSIHMTYEILEDIAEAVDIEWSIETESDYIFKLLLDNDEKVLFFGKENGENFISGYINNTNIELADYLNNPGIQKNQTVFVVYCSGDGCSLSEEVAFYMYDRYKISKILIYEGGMPEWVENGLPTEWINYIKIAR